MPSKISKTLAGINLDIWLKGLIVVSLAASIYPLFAFPIPDYIHNGDIGLHYRLTSLISQDPSYVAYEDYPKFLHLAASAFIWAFNLSVEHALILVNILFIAVFPVATYKLVMTLTRDRTLSLLSVLIALTTIVHHNVLTGLSMPVPQTLALVFFPLAIYFFLSGRYVFAGLVMGAHLMTHSSWPLTLIAILIATALQLRRNRRLGNIRPMLATFIIAFIVALPLMSYIKINLFHDTIISLVRSSEVYITSMIPFVSFPLIFEPAAILLALVYGIWRMKRDKKFNLLSYQFILILFFITLFLTQAYFFTSGLISGVTFIPSRIIPFLVLPIAIFSAYGIMNIFKSAAARNIFVILVSVLLVANFAVSYNDWYSTRGQWIPDSDLELAKHMQTYKGPQTVLYNPSQFYGAEGNLIDLGVKDKIDSASGFLILNGAKNISDYGVSLLLQRKGDSLVDSFVYSQPDKIKFVKSSDNYNLYEVINATSVNASPQYRLSDHVNSFTIFYNNYPVKRSLLQEPLKIRIDSMDTQESVCIEAELNLTIINCDSHDLKIYSNSKELREVFTTYSLSEFVYRTMWFYSNDRLGFELQNGSVMEMRIIKIPGINEDEIIYMPDIDSTISVNQADGTQNITVSRGSPGQYDYIINFKFLTRSAQWVLLNSYVTYPNVIPGAIYAKVREIA